MGGKDIPVVATPLSGAEADAGYAALQAVTRTYSEYQSRTDPEIRVFRVDAEPSGA